MNQDHPDHHLDPGSGDPRGVPDWHDIGVAHLRAGRYDEAVDALKRAVRDGKADAAYDLGVAFHNLHKHDHAEQAWRQVLQKTSQHELRIRAAERLASLYGTLGAPAAAARMRRYLDRLLQARRARVPRRRVRQTSDGWAVDESAGLARAWAQLPAALRRLLTLLSVPVTLVAFARASMQLWQWLHPHF